MNEFTIRTASHDDVPAIAAVMRESVALLGRTVYTDRQIASSLRFICRPDEQLIDDGTYFVAVIDSESAGCGGWSRRNTLSTPRGLLDPRIRATHIARRPSISSIARSRA